MRPTSELLNLFNNAQCYIRRKNCPGCYHNHGSQSEHLICMTDIDKEIYTSKTLIFLQNKIDIDEFDYLNYVYQLLPEYTDNEQEDLSL